MRKGKFVKYWKFISLERVIRYFIISLLMINNYQRKEFANGRGLFYKMQLTEKKCDSLMSVVYPYKGNLKILLICVYL